MSEVTLQRALLPCPFRLAFVVLKLCGHVPFLVQALPSQQLLSHDGTSWFAGSAPLVEAFFPIPPHSAETRTGKIRSVGLY